MSEVQTPEQSIASLEDEIERLRDGWRAALDMVVAANDHILHLASEDRMSEDRIVDGLAAEVERMRVERDQLRREVERLRDGIRRFHTRIDWNNRTWCEDCGGEWPCRTVRLLDGTDDREKDG